jgi:hypothetical protein
MLDDELTQNMISAFADQRERERERESEEWEL